MPSIIIPSRWRRQPQYPVEVDWNNPLTAGMRFAFQFIGGQCRDAITGARGAPSGSPTATVISQGQAIDIDGSDYFSVAHNTSHDLLESITLVWGGVIDTAGAYQHFAGKHSGGGGTNNPFDFRTDDSTPLKINLVRAGASGYVIYGSTQTLSTGVWGLYGVSQYTDIRGPIRFYKDGVGAAGNQVGGGEATGAATSAGDPLVIGRRSDGAVQLDGKVGLLYGWARALNDAEHLALYINPWQVFKARRRVLYFGTAGGGTSQVTSDLADSYAIRAAVSQDCADSYAIRSAITQDLADSYALRASVNGDLADSYAIRGAVAQDLADAYDIQTSGVVTSDLADSYAIRAAVAQDVSDSYAIRAAVQASLADAYSVRAAVQASLADAYTIITAASADLEDGYVIRAQAVADLIDSYAVFAGVGGGSCPSAAEIAAAVRAELAAELANMDAPVSDVPAAVWSHNLP